MFLDKTKKLWGFHPLQEAYFLQLYEENNLLSPARVISVSHDIFRVRLMDFDTEVDAKVRGLFHGGGNEWPVVGDWVLIEKVPGDHQFWPIESVLPRLSALKRSGRGGQADVLAVNMDFIALVTSFNLDLNERRLDRALAMIEESQATPLLIVNKKDLVTEAQEEKILENLKSRYLGVSVFSCSAEKSLGLDDFKGFLKAGQTIAFLGMSGVGKSTLVNGILQGDFLQTQSIRADDARGRHTTTHREMFLSKEGFWVIDTPGIREFSFAGSEEQLDESFEEITKFFGSCRFRDCSHQAEKGCAVLQSLEDGEISEDRWRNYLKMKREIEFQENKSNKKYLSDKKKQIAKLTSSVKKRHT